MTRQKHEFASPKKWARHRLRPTSAMEPATSSSSTAASPISRNARSSRLRPNEIDCTGLAHRPGADRSSRPPPRARPVTPGETDRHRHAGRRRGGLHQRRVHAEHVPSVDQPSVVTWILEKAKSEAVVNVFPTGAITKGIAGEELAPIGSMKKAGIVALTDDGHCIQNPEVMRRALEYARMFNLTVMDHCQDYALVGKGVMHEGYWSTVLGLPGWPAAGEEIIVQRNGLLAELTGTAIHCQHLSSGGSVRILREARSRGIPPAAKSARITSRSLTSRSARSIPTSR